VILASLYVGVGSGTYDDEDDGGGGDGTTGCREDELLRALRDAAARSAAGRGRRGGVGPRKVQVLLNANRALRGVSVTRNGEGGGQSHGRGGASSAVGVGGGGVVVTNSAEAVHSRLRPLLADDDRGRSGVFLFPVNDERLRRILPSPLDEVAGVFHMKAYIVEGWLPVDDSGTAAGREGPKAGAGAVADTHIRRRERTIPPPRSGRRQRRSGGVGDTDHTDPGGLRWKPGMRPVRRGGH
jgi:hypothetical protein